MATWRAENSMLTQKGIEILNKIKSGVGNITISRIVAGSGRVSSVSQLFNLSSVSGDTKPMVLTQVNTRGTGSEISIYISNEDFIEDFSLNQIGIYVTHPDYEGEQLYHISQCESTGVDIIPALNETPVTFGYNLFLEHGNSESISITVDPQGMVTLEQFNNFKGNIIPHNLVSVDEDGNLKDSGKSIEEVYNKNLLHNWDFRNPIDQKQGYIVVPGTAYYSNTALTSKVGDLTDYFRVTKVDDSYGRITINSVTYYVSWSSAVRGNFNHSVAFDRWSVNPGNSLSAVLIQNDGVLAKLSPSHGRISQSVTTKISPSLFAGKVVTASVKVESTSANYGYLYVNDGISQYGVRLTSAGIFKVTATIHDDTNGIGVIIQNTSADQYLDIKVSAIKLEMGSVSTLENDPPADYAEQLAICSQYNPWTGSYAGEIPYGYVEELVQVSSAEELDSKLDTLIANMPTNKVKFVIVNFGVMHPVLGGAGRVFRIDKLAETYAMIQALGYLPENQGVVSEYLRSKYNGVWTPWARTYNTYFKPTYTDVGAAPANFGLGEAVGKFVTDCNLAVQGGFYQFSNNTLNTPATYGVLVTLPRGTGVEGQAEYTAQLAIDHQLNMYIRNHREGSWTSWAKVGSTSVVPATVE